MYARPRIGEPPTQRAYENLHFGNFQLSKSRLPSPFSPIYSPGPLSAPRSPMTNRSGEVGCICLSPIANLRSVQRVDSVTTSHYSDCLSVCLSVCLPLRLSVCPPARSSVGSVRFRFASKCNFLISHWGNAVKNLVQHADKPSRLGLRGSKVDGARIQINDPAPQTTSAKNRRQRCINA